jgi:hypothetical protein
MWAVKHCCCQTLNKTLVIASRHPCWEKGEKNGWSPVTTGTNAGFVFGETCKATVRLVIIQSVQDIAHTQKNRPLSIKAFCLPVISVIFFFFFFCSKLKSYKYWFELIPSIFLYILAN